MSPLTLTLKSAPRYPVDGSVLSPDRLSQLEIKQLAQVRVRHGNALVPLGELFEISGDDPASLVVRNSHSNIHGLATSMSFGSMSVEGNAGDHFGQGMRGGSLKLSGDAGHWTASDMRGGLLEVRGNCGAFAGAALPGDRQGMRGGTLLIRGNSGDRTGDHQRGGYIVVEGDAGHYCGARMIAGTIAVWGSVGLRPGFAMRRGTLLLDEARLDKAPSFRFCGQHVLGFVELFLRSIASLNTKFTQEPRASDAVLRYMGDLAVDGKGELLGFQRSSE